MWAGPRLVSIRRRGSCAEGAWLKRGGVVFREGAWFTCERCLREVGVVWRKGRGLEEGGVAKKNGGGFPAPPPTA